MKKLVSTTLALAMLATPVGVMASSADKISKNDCSGNICECAKTVEPKKSHKLRNALIVGATVAGVAAISVATHKAASKACAAELNPKNKVLNAICDKNSKVSEISTEVAAQVKAGAGTAAKFVSNNTKAAFEKCKNLFARNNEESTAVDTVATTEEEQLVATVAAAATTEEEQPAVVEESSEEKGSEENFDDQQEEAEEDTSVNA